MTTNVCVDLPTLRKGSEGTTVRRLQHMLNPFVTGGEEGSPVVPPLKEDGDFGSMTEQAVKRFQGADVGTLAVDGIVGRATWTKLLAMWLTSGGAG